MKNTTKKEAYKLVKQVFNLAFGFSPACSSIEFDYIGAMGFIFSVGGRSYELIVCDDFNERSFNLAVYDFYGEGHHCYFTFLDKLPEA